MVEYSVQFTASLIDAGNTWAYIRICILSNSWQSQQPHKVLRVAYGETGLFCICTGLEGEGELDESVFWAPIENGVLIRHFYCMS